MPNLLKMGSTSDVLFRYGRRTVVLVEGAGDKNAFETIVGPGYEADIIFEVAPTTKGQGGCKAVQDRVRDMHQSNPRIFGLLDGEVAASLGGTSALLNCTDPLFTIPARNNLIFLGVHELENLYLSFANVPVIVAYHHPAARLHLHPPAAVKSTLDLLLGRFVKASVYKYTSAHLHSRGKMRNILSTRIFAQGGAAAIRQTVHAAVTSGNLTTWPGFVTELMSVGKIARASFHQSAPSAAGRRGWQLRVADGKELLARLRQLHGNVGDDVEGALLRDLVAGSYPTTFRAALFRATGVKPSTATI